MTTENLNRIARLAFYALHGLATNEETIELVSLTQDWKTEYDSVNHAPVVVRTRTQEAAEKVERVNREKHVV